MLFIIRFFFGHVIFLAQGAFPERFMNLTAQYGISLWNIKKDKGIFVAHCMASEYRTLRQLAKRSFMKLRIQKKVGMPFLLRRYKERKGLLVGIISFFIIIYLLSLRIWVINIPELEKLDKEEVRTALVELGIEPGTKSSRINASLLENSLMKKYNNISWVSANVIGSRLDVEIKEKVDPPEIPENDQPCNVKASSDAYITRMEIYAGNPEIHVGDAVQKGQLLVSGVLEDDLGRINLCHANAKIFAQTKKILKTQVGLNSEEEQKTGKVKKRKSVRFFGLKIPISIYWPINRNYKKEVNNHTLKVLNEELPFGFHEELWYEYKIEKIKRTKDEAINIAKENISKQESKIKDIKILNKEEIEKWIDGKLYLEVTYICEEDIAVLDPIAIQ